MNLTFFTPAFFGAASIRAAFIIRGIFGSFATVFLVTDFCAIAGFCAAFLASASLDPAFFAAAGVDAAFFARAFFAADSPKPAGVDATIFRAAFFALLGGAKPRVLRVGPAGGGLGGRV